MPLYPDFETTRRQLRSNKAHSTKETLPLHSSLLHLCTSWAVQQTSADSVPATNLLHVCHRVAHLPHPRISQRSRLFSKKGSEKGDTSLVEEGH